MEMQQPTETPAIPFREAAFGDLEREFASTRRALERLPEEHFAWRPHERSWTLQELATHITNLPQWLLTTATTDSLDFLAMPPAPAMPEDRAGMLRQFDENAAAARAAFDAMDDAQFADPWSLRAGDQIVFTISKLATIRTYVVNHMVHHRAQLLVYYRLLDVPVPGIYGPSADESPA